MLMLILRYIALSAKRRIPLKYAIDFFSKTTNCEEQSSEFIQITNTFHE